MSPPLFEAIILSGCPRGLALGPSDLGLLTSSYFLTFAAFKLPLGIMLDRYPVQAGRYAVAGYGAAFGACFVLVLAPYVLLLVSRRASKSRE